MSSFARAWWKPGPLPGFGLTLGFSMLWLSLVVLVPLLALLVRAAGLGPAGWWKIASDERVLRALELSFGTALVAALVVSLVGGLIAWVLVRYRFPGRALADALIDLPFALPTAVAGIALTALYAGNGWLGAFLEPHGIKVAYAPLGIVVALLFVGLPFTVRTVQPVLEALHVEHEEAAASLGASRFTTLRRVVFPQLLPAMKITEPYSPAARASASAKPVRSAGASIGSSTRVKVCQRRAPRLSAASSISRSRFSSTGCSVRTTNGNPTNAIAISTPCGA
jgi:sulfate transport system permease protein